MSTLAELVYSIRDLADYVEARPDLPRLHVRAAVCPTADQQMDLRRFALAVDEYVVERPSERTVALVRHLGNGVALTATGHRDQICRAEYDHANGRTRWEVPDLGGRRSDVGAPA